jgi:hypothetical protein
MLASSALSSTLEHSTLDALLTANFSRLTAPAAFRIVREPPDFRLKEMKRCLLDQERGKSTKEVRRQISAETANHSPQPSLLHNHHAALASVEFSLRLRHNLVYRLTHLT